MDYINDPEKYDDIGFNLPKGVLLYGPPGTGKTLLAKAVANECKIPFIYACGSEFVEIYVGNGAKRIWELFEEAWKYEKCVIFIDEIDTLGSKRGQSGYNRESDQTLNQLLSEMDGFNHNGLLTVIAATNQKDNIDVALLWAGRFDRKIEVELPNVQDRESILRIHLKKRSHAISESCIKDVSHSTGGMCGSDIEVLVNESASLAIRDKS